MKTLLLFLGLALPALGQSTSAPSLTNPLAFPSHEARAAQTPPRAETSLLPSQSVTAGTGEMPASDIPIIRLEPESLAEAARRIRKNPEEQKFRAVILKRSLLYEGWYYAFLVQDLTLSQATIAKANSVLLEDAASFFQIAVRND
jgi:hypothetical protein